ncbi:MAG: small multi-drug export protein [Thermoplasmata archaeon]
MLVYSFPNAFGKETLIPLAVYGLRAVNGNSFMNVIIASSAVSSIDFIYATFMLFNFDYAHKIPIVGKYILNAQLKGEKTISKNPWMQKSAFLAIFLYALIPIQGAGGFASSIVGRIIGLEKVRVWLASSLGSLVGCLILGLAADTIFATFERNIIQGLELLLLFIVLGVIIYLLYQKYLKNTHVIQNNK